MKGTRSPQSTFDAESRFQQGAPGALSHPALLTHVVLGDPSAIRVYLLPLPCWFPTAFSRSDSPTRQMHEPTISRHLPRDACTGPILWSEDHTCPHRHPLGCSDLKPSCRQHHHLLHPPLHLACLLLVLLPEQPFRPPSSPMFKTHFRIKPNVWPGSQCSSRPSTITLSSDCPAPPPLPAVLLMPRHTEGAVISAHSSPSRGRSAVCPWAPALPRTPCFTAAALPPLPLPRPHPSPSFPHRSPAPMLSVSSHGFSLLWF